jgi:ubiquinone/menaquinone biosynthesis C-methylase UbiE
MKLQSLSRTFILLVFGLALLFYSLPIPVESKVHDKIRNNQDVELIKKSDVEIRNLYQQIQNTPKTDLRRISQIKYDLSMIYMDRADYVYNLNEGEKGIEASRKDYEASIRLFNESGYSWDLLQKKVSDWDLVAIKNLKIIKKGDSIADLGAGIGMYIFFLENLAGSKGKVFAVDVNSYCLDFIKKARKSREYGNIILIKNTFDSMCLPDNSIDFALTRCSVYDILGMKMAMKKQNEKSSFMSIYKALKPNGLLCITEDIPMEFQAGPDRFLAECIQNMEKTKKFRLVKKIENRKARDVTYILIFKK